MLKQLSTLAISGLMLGLTQITQAATITDNFQVTIDSGPLLGNIYSGSLSYDDSLLTGIGTESTLLTDFSFIFDSNSYSELDDLNAVARFLNGNFLGIDYAVALPPSPTFISGNTALSEAFFAYDLGGIGNVGTGIIDFSSGAVTPEPTAILGLLALVSLGIGSKLKRGN